MVVNLHHALSVVAACSMSLAAGPDSPAPPDPPASSGSQIVRQLIAPEASTFTVQQIVQQSDDAAGLEQGLLDVLADDPLFEPGTRAADLAAYALATAPDGDGDQVISTAERYQAMADAVGWAENETKRRLLQRMQDALDPALHADAAQLAADTFTSATRSDLADTALRTFTRLGGGNPALSAELRLFLADPEGARPDLWASAVEDENDPFASMLSFGPGTIEPGSRDALLASSGSALLQAGDFAAADLDRIEAMAQDHPVPAASAILQTLAAGKTTLDELDAEKRSAVIAATRGVLSRPDSIPYLECCGGGLLLHLAIEHPHVRDDIIVLFTDLLALHPDNETVAGLQWGIDLLNAKTARGL